MVAVRPTLAVPTEPTTEYVSGGGALWPGYTQAVRALPHPIDDLTADFGPDLYERMALDPKIAAVTTILRASIIEDGPTLTPAVTDEASPDYEQAQELATWCTDVLDNLTTPLADVLWSMSAAILSGYVVAEQVYTQRGGKLVVTGIKPKPRTSTAFVVDAYSNVVGLLAVIPGKSPSLTTSSYLSTEQLATAPGFLPREKFAIYTFRPRHGDPRGTSVLRPAYDPWWCKQQMKPQHLQYLTQFAAPSLIATLSENAQRIPVVDQDGAIISYLEPAEAMYNALATFRNGTGLVIPNGATVEPVLVSGDGQPFMTAFDWYDRQITMAILTQTLATSEGEHASRAQAGVHQDVLDTIIRQAKQGLARMLRHDVLRVMVRLNYGEAAEHLTPLVSLGETEAPDLATMWAAFAQLYRSGAVDASQLPAIDSMLNLPPRMPADQQAVAPDQPATVQQEVE